MNIHADPDLAPNTVPARPAPAAERSPPPVGPFDARREALRREARYFAILGGFGVLLLPLAVYLAGAATLGPYEGGLPSFLGKLYLDFFTATPAALLLLLGPYLLFQALRLLTRPLRNRDREIDAEN